MSIEKRLNIVIHTAHLFDIGEKHGKSDDKLGTRKLELASYLLSPVMRIAINQTNVLSATIVSRWQSWTCRSDWQW